MMSTYKKKAKAATKIQSVYRGGRTRKKIVKNLNLNGTGLSRAILVARKKPVYEKNIVNAYVKKANRRK